MRRALQEPDDVVIRRGRVDVSARTMAALALQRASREKISAAMARSVDIGYAKVRFMLVLSVVVIVFRIKYLMFTFSIPVRTIQSGCMFDQDQ